LTLAEYRGFLHDLYHIVWHFCPVMSAAAARCDDRFRDVRYDLYERIEEEKGHDSWVLEDIEALGGDVRAVRETPPSPPAQAMIAFNYYASDRVHPCSVLGMLYMLEVVSSVYGGGFPTPSRGRWAATSKMADSNSCLRTPRWTSTIWPSSTAWSRRSMTLARKNAIVNATRVNFHQFGQLFREGGGLLAT